MNQSLPEHQQPFDSEVIRLAQQLNHYPELRRRIEALLAIVENEKGDLVSAHAAEEHVLEEIRKLAQLSLQTWAEREVQQQSEHFRQQNPQANQHSKKKLYWYSRFGTVEVQEQTFINQASKTLARPFSQSAQVTCRSYSLPLQRVITDFGADVPFGKIPGKMLEHHGISVSVSSAQAITQQHAQIILDLESLNQQKTQNPGVERLVSQMDGTSIPIVTFCVPPEQEPTQDAERNPDEIVPMGIDHRKYRQVGRMEARLSLSRSADTKQPFFAVSLSNVEDAGNQLFQSALKAGFGTQTQVHGVGDGAPWIVNQFQQSFGTQATYLLDFYHLSEYLAEGGKVCAPTNPLEWLTQQQANLKANQSEAVLAAMQPFIEAESCADDSAPVRRAYRYLANRPEQLDYKGALEADLPIGSGEIESAHRYVIQERLKRAGCWWTVEKAWAMIALRITRFNQDWDAYWDAFPQMAMAA